MHLPARSDRVFLSFLACKTDQSPEFERTRTMVVPVNPSMRMRMLRSQAMRVKQADHMHEFKLNYKCTCICSLDQCSATIINVHLLQLHRYPCD